MNRTIPIIFLLLCLASFEAMFVYYIDVLQVLFVGDPTEQGFLTYDEIYSRFTSVIKIAIAINLFVSILILALGMKRLEASIAISTLLYCSVLFSNLAALFGLCSMTFVIC